MGTTTINVTTDTDCCILQLFPLEDDVIKFETWCIYRVQKNSMPKLCEVTGGDQNKDLLARNYVGYSERKYRLRISLTHPRDCPFAHVQ
jgi:hypothetical protein